MGTGADTVNAAGAAQAGLVPGWAVRLASLMEIDAGNVERAVEVLHEALISLHLASETDGAELRPAAFRALRLTRGAVD